MGAANHGQSDAFERASQGALRASPQKEGPPATPDEQAPKLEETEQLPGKLLESPQNEHHK